MGCGSGEGSEAGPFRVPRGSRGGPDRVPKRSREGPKGVPKRSRRVPVALMPRRGKPLPGGAARGGRWESGSQRNGEPEKQRKAGGGIRLGKSARVYLRARRCAPGTRIFGWSGWLGWFCWGFRSPVFQVCRFGVLRGARVGRATRARAVAAVGLAAGWGLHGRDARATSGDGLASVLPRFVLRTPGSARRRCTRPASYGVAPAQPAGNGRHVPAVDVALTEKVGQSSARSCHLPHSQSEGIRLGTLMTARRSRTRPSGATGLWGR